ncbi:MAG: hypothetical protein R3A78_11970 [Polyangiales bacterium]|nr:hypothetical protein [Myxococcales bacterium]
MRKSHHHHNPAWLRLSLVLALIGAACGGASAGQHESPANERAAGRAHAEKPGELHTRSGDAEPDLLLDTELEPASTNSEPQGARSRATEPPPNLAIQPAALDDTQLPLTPDRASLSAIVEGAHPTAEACVLAGTRAKIRAHITIRSEGTVEAVVIEGKPIEGTPEAQCIVNALTALTFPRFRDPYYKYVHVFEF